MSKKHCACCCNKEYNFTLLMFLLMAVLVLVSVWVLTCKVHTFVGKESLELICKECLCK